MRKDVVKTDILIVGAGIAGLMAAIRACELGARVVVAEKGNAKYSGSGRAGNDHFWCYIPEVHGPDMGTFIQECMLKQQGPMLRALGPRIVKAWVERTFDMVKLWDAWGIPMKHDGQWYFSGHAFPGRMRQHLKYRGENQKLVLVEQALKRGAEIMDRLMVFDLLGDEKQVRGALAIDTREERLVVFHAGSVILGTGFMVRLFPNVTPALMANNTRPMTTCGDGRAMAYRLGAGLINMEMLSRQPGMKNFARSGQATWSGVCRDPYGKPVGKFISRPERLYSDMIMEVDSQVFERYQQSGRGPVYMDCTGISEEDLQYMIQGLGDEGNIAALEHFREEGIDLRKNPIEFSTYELRSNGRILTNERAETCVPGLYAAGDETGLSISGAAVFGWISGENASKHAKETPAADMSTCEAEIEEKTLFLHALQEKKEGTDWYDANMALQHTMADYAGLTRSESMLEAGLRHLRRLEKKLRTTVVAKDRWELTRCLEVANLFDLGEALFIAALERKESRGLHKRVDYPYTDPLLNNKMLIIRKIGGRPQTEWREQPR